MKKIAVITLMCMLILSSVRVSAGELTCGIGYNYKESKIQIAGEAVGGNDYVVLVVLKKDVSFDDYYNVEDKQDLILYCKQMNAESGKYNFGFSYKNEETGRYGAILSSSSDGSLAHINLKLISYEEFCAAYDDLNKAASDNNKKEFAKIISEKYPSLDFDFSMLGSESVSETDTENYFKFVKENPLDTAFQEKNSAIFKTFMLCELLNSGKLADIGAYTDDIYFENKMLLNDYKKLAQIGEFGSYATEKMSFKNITSLKGFYTEFKKAILLGGVKYSVGYGAVKELFKAYNDVIGVNTNVSDSVFKEITGNDYKDIDALIADYNRKLQKKNVSAPSGGGGGGGSAPKTLYRGDSLTVGGAVKPVEDTFTDIEGVDWAVEAILALSDKQIINGTEPGIFKPNDKITREEFAKILVGAMGYSPDLYEGNVFSDVTEDDWFCKYVNIAALNGIVQGIGNNCFGSRNTITRQDMCVMLYNALRQRKPDLTGDELVFEDSGLIAEYAKPAVAALYKMGAVNGVSSTEFEPEGYATRAQAAKIIYSVLDDLN